MTRFRIPIAIALLLIPILARGLWFNQGFYWRSEPVATPDYESYTIPQPPLSTALPPEEAGNASTPIILLDQAHTNQFSPSEIDSLIGLLNSRNARVEAVTSGGYKSRSLADQLKYATALVSICPTETFSTEEIQQIQDFTNRGGRLLVFTDPTRPGSSSGLFDSGPVAQADDVNAANALLAPFDIAFADDYLYNMTTYEGNFRNVIFQQFSGGALTSGLGKVVLYAARSVQTRTGTSILTSADLTLSSRTDTGGGLSAAATNAAQNVLAIGDITFLQPPYSQVADNPLFIRRLADFLLGAERIHPLSEFPFLFQRPVAIVPMKDIRLDADLLGPLNALTQDLASVGIASTVAPAPEDGKDLILLGTYSSAGVEDVLQPLGISLPSTDSTGGGQIIIPKFGSIKPNGTGLILLLHDTNRTTLVLLAVDSASLSTLMDVIGPSGFSNCVLQGEVAVCGIGSASSGSGDWWNIEAGGIPGTPTPDLSSTLGG